MAETGCAVMLAAVVALALQGDALESFRKAFAYGELAEKTEALEALAAEAPSDGLEAIEAVFVTHYNRLVLQRKQQAKIKRRIRAMETILDHKKRRSIDPQEIEREELKILLKRVEDLEPLEKKITESETLDPLLVDTYRRILAANKAAVAKKADARLKKSATKDILAESQAGSLALYCRLGRPDAEGLAINSLKAALKERRSNDKELPKLQKRLEALEERLQEESVRGQGLVPAALTNDYRLMQTKVTQIRRRMAGLVVLVEGAAEAGSAYIATLSGEPAVDAADKVLKAAGSGEREFRYLCMAMLRGCTDPGLLSAVLAFVDKAKDAGLQAAGVDVLAGAGVPELLALARDRFLLSPSWEVRIAAVRALRKVRDLSSLAVLVDAMDRETGRVKAEVRDALRDLTGMSWGYDSDTWRKWLGETGGELVAAKAEGEAEDEGTGLHFYGIRSESDRVLFVLDVSGSMLWDLHKDDVEPQEGDLSRIKMLKQECLRAVAGLADGAKFNILVYAWEVKQWQSKPQVMNDKVRAEAREWVEGLQAVGATNLFGALKEGFKMAGVGASSKYYEPAVDTIFFMSDVGQEGSRSGPSAGEIQNTDDILTFVREWNRLGKITVHAIGVGDGHDAAFMQALAEENGGRYVAR